MSATIHIINQNIWPDGSPVTIYAEQLALNLAKREKKVVLVGGRGIYRASGRPAPACTMVKLPTSTKDRDKKLSVVAEYLSSFLQTSSYIRKEVENGDTVIVTSSPFIFVFLLPLFLGKKVRKVFWLSDYFPRAITAVNRSFRFMGPLISNVYDFFLRKWDYVIKISGNLDYHGENAVVYRFWPTIQVHPEVNQETEKSVLYTGNLGFAHAFDAVMEKAKEFHDQGYKVRFYADGPYIKKLPPWVDNMGILKEEAEINRVLNQHDIHLVAGTPGTDGASFPSKIWNSLALGKKIEPCGFSGAMNEELREITRLGYKENLDSLTAFVMRISD